MNCVTCHQLPEYREFASGNVENARYVCDECHMTKVTAEAFSKALAKVKVAAKQESKGLDPHPPFPSEPHPPCQKHVPSSAPPSEK